MGYSPEQLRILEINAKVSGSISILGSSRLVYEILRHESLRSSNNSPPGQSVSNMNTKRGCLQMISVLHQILLGMSLFDIGASSMYFVGSWAIPSDVEGNQFQPSGTDATCTAQGFLFQTFASAIPFYNLSLSIYYYLTINHSWKEDRMRRRWFVFHILPCTFGILTATYGVATQQFNPNELWCWFTGTEQSNLLKFLFYYGVLWVIFAVIITLFALMYRHVRKQETAIQRYSFANIALRRASDQQGSMQNEDHSASDHMSQHMQAALQEEERKARRLSRPIFIQGLLFTIVFFITFFFPTLFRALQFHYDQITFFIPFMMTLFLPLQGCMNYLVFKRQFIQSFFCRRSNRKNRNSIQALPNSNRNNTENGGGAADVANITAPSEDRRKQMMLNPHRRRSGFIILGTESQNELDNLKVTAQSMRMPTIDASPTPPADIILKEQTLTEELEIIENDFPVDQDLQDDAAAAVLGEQTDAPTTTSSTRTNEDTDALSDHNDAITDSHEAITDTDDAIDG